MLLFSCAKSLIPANDRVFVRASLPECTHLLISLGITFTRILHEMQLHPNEMNIETVRSFVMQRDSPRTCVDLEASLRATQCVWVPCGRLRAGFPSISCGPLVKH